MDPRKEFRAGPHAKPWADISASEAFRAAATAAMMQMVSSGDKLLDASFGQQIAGAKNFLQFLEQLGEPDPKTRAPIASANLDHTA